MSSFLIQHARTQDGDLVDIAIREGTITEVTPAGQADTAAFDPSETFDADGRLVTPSFSEPHTHLDTALTVGKAPQNESGTLEEGWHTWEVVRKELTKKGVKQRVRKNLTWFVSNGVTRVRTHFDVTTPHWESLEALLELREELSDVVDLELVAFPIDSVVDDPETIDQMKEALDRGVDIVGGLPHREATREAGVEHVKRLVSIAEEYDRRMDFHIDESDDPSCRYTEVFARETGNREIGHRATASHLTAMHSYPNTYANKLCELIATNDLRVITNPTANAIIQGRYDDYPRRRGHTRIEALRDAGVTVGIGQDDIMDSTYQYGDGDPLKAAFVLMHFAHMNLRRDVPMLWDMLTEANAEIFGVDQYGLEEGAEGSLVVFDSPDAFNALRTQPPRSLVLKEGRKVAEAEATTTVHFDGAEQISYNHSD